MTMQEFEPVGEWAVPRALRLDESFVLTCAACGCRLTARESLRDGGRIGPDAAWRHFWGMPGHDARGCRVACIDQPHRITPLEASAGQA
jgi:hypothetical protein